MESNKHPTRASPSPPPPDRKTVEKNRRNKMKGLYSELSSLVPRKEASDEENAATSIPDQLDEAANYVKKLQIKVEKMREKKENLLVTGPVDDDHDQKLNINIEVNEAGSALQVVLISGLEYHQLVFNDAIRVLHEEGAEVVNASFTVSDQTVFHTIHCEIGESSSSDGASRISMRLNKLVRDTNAN